MRRAEGEEAAADGEGGMRGGRWGYAPGRKKEEKKREEEKKQGVLGEKMRKGKKLCRSVDRP